MFLLKNPVALIFLSYTIGALLTSVLNATGLIRYFYNQSLPQKQKRQRIAENAHQGIYQCRGGSFNWICFTVDRQYLYFFCGG